jgi:hypothetical protein
LRGCCVRTTRLLARRAEYERDQLDSSEPDDEQQEGVITAPEGADGESERDEPDDAVEGGGGTGEPRRWLHCLRELSVDRLRQPRSQLGHTGIADGSPLGDNALDLALARPREALPVLVEPGAEAAAQVASALPKHHQIMAPKRAVFALLPWPG